jgi:hypothetical protein
MGCKVMGRTQRQIGRGVLFGKKDVPIIELPQGTLLFRVVDEPMTDFTGVKVEDGSYCIPPQYNVFFYFDPFSAEIFPEYLGMIPTVEVYKLKHTVKIVSMVAPSTLTKAQRISGKGVVKSCNKTRRSCLKGREYDACLSETFIAKYPDVVGWIGLGRSDSTKLLKEIKSGVLQDKAEYIHLLKDSRGVKGSPELALYPLRERQMQDINIDNPAEWMQNQDFNFEHVASLSRDKKTLVDFLTTNARFVQGSWYYSQ